MLSIKNLSVQYEEKLAVDDISIDIPQNKITGLIGPNGAGKSSLIKACVGMISEYSGEILYDEKPLHKNRHWVKEHCSYAPEDTVLLPFLKGREYLELIGTLRKTADLDNEITFLFKMLNLHDKENELIINYSHGMCQKISIASTLIGKSDYLIFDEALNGLDPIALYNLKNYLNELAAAGKTIILSSHILALIQDWCDPIIIMHQGKILKMVSKEEIARMESEKKQSFERIFIELVK
ncbi:MAG TPA: ABC transporter ATP-binding protein [Caldithrix sp.]|nr:ABC transporter ATP-binding protein [Calditrichaceae bacterium]HEM49376.1 ABC transporter ATP-binding protein [Caldithrix sp.]